MAKQTLKVKVDGWRRVRRTQLAQCLGVHPDTITDYAAQGMPVITKGGRGKESQYDLVECMDWWRERQGKNAKEAAQTRLYEANAEHKELQIAQVQEGLVSREEIKRDGEAAMKGWSAQVRAIPRRARHAGIITSLEQETELAGLCRLILTEISSWNLIADVVRSLKALNAG